MTKTVVARSSLSTKEIADLLAVGFTPVIQKTTSGAVFVLENPVTKSQVGLVGVAG